MFSPLIPITARVPLCARSNSTSSASDNEIINPRFPKDSSHQQDANCSRNGGDELTSPKTPPKLTTQKEQKSQSQLNDQNISVSRSSRQPSPVPQRSPRQPSPATQRSPRQPSPVPREPAKKAIEESIKQLAISPKRPTPTTDKPKSVNNVPSPRCLPSEPGRRSLPEHPIIESGTAVKITYVGVKNQVHIRPVVDRLEDEYTRNLYDINEFARGSPAERNLAVGRFIAAPFNGSLARARILEEPKDGKVKIGFMDFGDYDRIPITEAKCLSDELAGRRVLISKIHLHNAEDSDEFKDFLNGLVKERTVFKLMYDGPFKFVDENGQSHVSKCELRIFDNNKTLFEVYTMKQKISNSSESSVGQSAGAAEEVILT